MALVGGGRRHKPVIWHHQTPNSFNFPIQLSLHKMHTPASAALPLPGLGSASLQGMFISLISISASFRSASVELLSMESLRFLGWSPSSSSSWSATMVLSLEKDSPFWSFPRLSQTKELSACPLGTLAFPCRMNSSQISSDLIAAARSLSIWGMRWWPFCTVPESSLCCCPLMVDSGAILSSIMLYCLWEGGGSLRSSRTSPTCSEGGIEASLTKLSSSSRYSRSARKHGLGFLSLFQCLEVRERWS